MITFLNDNARWIMGGFLLTLFSSFGQTFFIGLSGEEIRETFSLSDGQFGLIYMGATLASAMTLPVLGRTLDRMTGRMVTLFVVPLLATACLLIAAAPSLLLLVLAIYLLRLFGQGMLSHIALTEIGRWYAAHRGLATSLVVPGHQAGEAVLPILFVLTAAQVGWRGTWVVAAILLVGVALPLVSILWRVQRVPQSTAGSGRPDNTARDWTRAQVIRDPMFYAVLIAVLAPPFIGTTIFFHQDYLIELRGYDPLVFAGAFPMMAATTVGFSLLCGALVDRFGALRLLPWFLIPLAVASAAAGLLEPVWAAYLFMVLLGVSYGFTSTLLGAVWPEIYGVAHLGAVRALVVSAMVFSTALGPGLTGALIDLGVGLPVQLLAMSGWCIAGCLILGMVAPRIQARNAAQPT